MSTVDHWLTVVIPTSPIPSHSIGTNRTAIIDKTLQSIRHHIPNSKIIIMADGVRPQVEHRRSDYEVYKRELRAKLGQYGDCEMTEFDSYTQQAKMLRLTLERVKTPLVFFAEHDTSLVTTHNPRDGAPSTVGGIETLPEDLIIDWEAIGHILMSNGAYQVQLCYWQQLPQSYFNFWQGELPREYYSAGKSLPTTHFYRTRQYSQWPNVGRLDFYKRILADHFHPHAIQMIEIPMATIAASSPWQKFKIAVYYPDGNARRFYHNEGRIDPRSGHKDAVDW